MPNAPAMPAPHRTADDETLALLRLVAAGGSAAARRDLLDRLGSPAGALAAGAGCWRAAGLDDRQVAALRSGATEPLAHAANWLAGSSQRSLIGWHDPDYPPLLRRISSPPLALFVEGDAALLWRPVVAVVGSRAATVAGCEHAHGFALELARAGYVIGSGLASGVDAAAHRAALSLGPGNTLAVLGCGPDRAYPASHRSLLAQVAAAGCVVSEHLPGVQARREFFPSRNRILAGLSLGTLVVEAGERSGALITARQAADAGREVFAIPGSIRNPLSRGCHRLIRDGATLVESAHEVNAILSPLAAGQAVALRARLGGPTQQHADECASAGIRGPSPAPAWADDPDYNRLWKALTHDPSPMDQLVQRSGLTAAKLSSMLLVMELEGRVAVEHGRYSRK
jgi:DNA processing protein